MAGILQNIGDALTNGLGNGLLKNEVGDEYTVLKSHYEESENDNPQAFVNKKGGVPGSYSLFNPFRIFRYSGFGMNDQAYERDMHFDSKSVPVAPGTVAGLLSPVNSFAEDAVDAVTANSAILKSFNEVKKKMENPTASDIIRWSHLGEAMSPVPYSPQDFLWCKYYGKVPNNRMVTLRRYPMPIEDDIRIHDDKAPAIPIAQAVSWYGTDIGNDLNKILNVSWGLKWTERTSKVQDIAGNEITVEQIAEAAGLSTSENEKIINILKTQVFSGNGTQDILKLSGYDVEIQQYIKDAYGSEGPYWNRILGPVNAVDRTMIRDRGFESQPDVVINFEYSLRSHGGINPKIAFLDLLTNFLSLTYNTAPFWGGGARYFQTTGVTTPNFGMENAILDGDVYGGLTQGAETLAALAQKNINDLVEFAKEIAGGTYGEKGAYDTDAIQDRRRQLDEKFATGADPISKMLAPRLGKLMRKPLIYRAILDGRAVGEWHLTVGNPMNPMAMIGNLCLSNVKMTVGETLGIDDFPTEFKFEVTLKHGRPRAKQDIESMFNLGKGRMAFDQLAPPSSSLNSLGESNTRKANAWYDGVNPENPQAAGTGTVATGANTDDIGLSSMSQETGYNIPGVDGDGNAGNLERTVARYSRQVGNMYGSFYGSSPVLTDYFKSLKTKD